MNIQRLLNIIALLLFIAFVATFFTVLVRLSRIGLVTERFTTIYRIEQPEKIAVLTEFRMEGQNSVNGTLVFTVRSEIDTQTGPFSNLREGEELVLRIENLVEDVSRNYDLSAIFRNPTGDRWVTIEFGEFEMDVLDRRDFYPFDGYELSFNYTIHGNYGWYEPDELKLRSATNLIFLNPRYEMTDLGREGFRMRVGRLRLQQFLTMTLILIEILFLLYLLTIVNTHELLAKSLGYLLGLFIIRQILVTSAPMFPTFVDYSTLFLFCVVFFLMLFKFLGGTEERAMLKIPTAWINGLSPGTKQASDKNEPVDDPGEKTAE